MTKPLAVLIGPMGSGKSSVARVLGRRMNVATRDTDDDVVASTSRSIADVFVEDGEPAFRELEHAAVVAALSGFDGILALGGGAVLDPRTQEALLGHTIVFLDVRITDAARRIGLNRDRPLLLGNPRAQWTVMMEARRPVYQQVAGARVATDGLSIDEVADRVRAVLLELTHGASS